MTLTMPVHRALRLGKEKALEMFRAYGENVTIKSYTGEEILSIEKDRVTLLGKVVYNANK